MNHPTSSRSALTIAFLLALTANLAWAGDEKAEETGTAVATPATETAADSAAGAAASEAEQEKTGLDIVMDGTSLEAWNQSMEEVRKVGGQADYARLQKAFDYLLAFDIGAKKNPEVLASRLNGLTGHQIIERVGYGRGRK